jgi:hypothetical protein
MSKEDRETEIQQKYREAEQRENEGNSARETRQRDERNSRATTDRPITANRRGALYAVLSPEERKVADDKYEADMKLREQDAKSEAEEKQKKKG